MVVKSDRFRIAIAIIVCHGILLLVLFMLFAADAILLEEFTPLATLLTPITTMYIGLASKYLANSISLQIKKEEEEIANVKLFRYLIFVHFALMISLLVAKAVFNWIEFSTLTIGMTIIEAFFGGLIGGILNVIFIEKANK